MTIQRIAALAAGAVLTLGPVALAQGPASAGAPEPCATQQTQVDRAEAALDRVTAVFERAQERVAGARRDVRQAAPGREKAQARRDLSRAEDRRDDVAKVKKAQRQRLAKAEQRLADCQAEQTEPAAPAEQG